MSSNLRVNSIVPATGTNVAIGTAGGTITYGASVAGVSTFTTINATSIVGVATAGITTAYIGSVNDGPISGSRNKIINGNMRIDQRNAGVSTTGANSYPVDRWRMEYNGNGSITGIQTSDVPTGQSFTNAVKLTSTARSTLGSADFYQLSYYIEGHDISDFDYGSSSAKTVTLSFWVKASTTGTYQVQLANGGTANGTRTHTKTYTVSVADTWQKVILTYPGCTTGTWEKTNGLGIGIRFGFEYGTNFTSGATADTWVSTTLFASSFVTTTNTFTTNSNATWYITGVQLETGTVATPFERRSYGQELALCQRYCFVINGSSSFNGTGYARYFLHGSSSSGGLSYITFPVQMRTTPTLLTKNFVSGNVDIFNYSTASGATFVSVASAEHDVWHAQLTFTLSGTLASGHIMSWRWANVPDAYIGFSAEL